MKLFKRVKKREIQYLGYRKQLLPILEKAMADFLLRISVNSSYVTIGVYDIGREGFYKHSIADFIAQLPESLSIPDEFSSYLKPYVSDKFGEIVHSESHELIIAAFYEYYHIRLPFLIFNGRFVDWPQNKGVSESDLERFSVYSFYKFESFFPAAAKMLIGKGPQDLKSLFYQYADGKHIALNQKLKKEQISQFIYDSEPIWQKIIEAFPDLIDNWNVITFVESVFKEYFHIFWDYYKSDYMETLRLWSMLGAFEGDDKSPAQDFWKDLEKRLDRHDFILRTAELY